MTTRTPLLLAALLLLLSACSGGGNAESAAVAKPEKVERLRLPKLRSRGRHPQSRVRTGMRIYDARRLCPGLIQRPARPGVYARESTRIMHALTAITPDVEVFSVDEAFLDVTHCQRLHGTPEAKARMAQALVHAASSGLPCSVGVAGTKLTAKYASDVVKPNGITVIAPWEARARLRDVPADKLCGIGPRIAAFLARFGARTCGEVAALPLEVLARRYGITGKHLWLACQGRDTGGVVRDGSSTKSASNMS